MKENIYNNTPKVGYLKYLFPSFLFIICAIVMQYHAIPFWVESMGEIGIVVSILLEFIAIWHWFHKKVIIGSLTSLLLITGPLANMVMPFLDEHKKSIIHDEILKINQEALTSEESVRKDLSGSSWAGIVKDNLTEKRALTKQTLSILKESSSIRYAWIPIAIGAMQVMLLLIILLTQIHLLGVFRKYRIDDQNALFHEYGNLWKVPENGDDKDELLVYAHKVFNQLSQLQEQLNGSWKDVADYLEIPQTNITRIKNLTLGKDDIASFEMIKRVEERLKSKPLVVYGT